MKNYKKGDPYVTEKFFSKFFQKTIYTPYFGPEKHDFDGFRPSCPGRNFFTACPISKGNFTLEIGYAVEKFLPGQLDLKPSKSCFSGPK